MSKPSSRSDCPATGTKNRASPRYSTRPSRRDHSEPRINSPPSRASSSMTAPSSSTPSRMESNGGAGHRRTHPRRRRVRGMGLHPTDDLAHHRPSRSGPSHQARRQPRRRLARRLPSTLHREVRIPRRGPLRRGHLSDHRLHPRHQPGGLNISTATPERSKRRRSGEHPIWRGPAAAPVTTYRATEDDLARFSSPQADERFAQGPR